MRAGKLSRLENTPWPLRDKCLLQVAGNRAPTTPQPKHLQAIRVQQTVSLLCLAIKAMLSCST